jgi:hypothetical protein
MRILEVAVQDIESVRGYYTSLKIYRAATYDGTYTELPTVSPVPLVAGQTLYPVVDNDGLASSCYRYSYYKSTLPTAESSLLDIPIYYCTVAGLKARLNETGTADDQQFVDAVAAATGAIRRYCNREFKQVVETRYFEGPSPKGGFTGRGPQILFVDDLVAVTALQLDYGGGGVQNPVLTTLTVNTDFYLWPQDADRQEEPFQGLAFVPGANFQVQAVQTGVYREQGIGLYWPRGYQAVRITGTWGWPLNAITQSSVPPAIKEACLEVAARIYKGRDNAYSRVVGAEGVGTMKIADDLLNRDTKLLLNSYRRMHNNY